MARIKRVKFGWLIDGRGGPALANGEISVSDGMVESIAAGAETATSAKITPEVEIVDLSEYTVIPALIDCHVHLFMSGTTDMAVRRRQLEAGYEELASVISGHVRNHLDHGVMAVRDGGDRLGLAMRYRDSSPPGKIAPMRLKVAGRAWNSRGRYGKLIGRSPAKGLTLAEAVEKDLAGVYPQLPDHVKIVNSGINSLKKFGKQTPPQFDFAEMKAAVEVCSKHGLPVMVHANGRDPVRIAVDAGCRSIEHGFFMGEDNLRRMADLGAFWVPTACTMKGYAETLAHGSPGAAIAGRYLDHQLEQMAMGKTLGVSMAVGTDAGSMGVNHGEAVVEELELFAKAGFTVEEAIGCATGKAASLLGLDTLGELRPGKKAAFIAVKGRPENVFQNYREAISGRNFSERPIVDF